MTAAITALRSIEMGVTDMESATQFYSGAWGLSVVHRSADAVYLRATGADFYVLGLHRRPTAALLRFDLRTSTKTAVDQLHKAVVAAGATALSRPAPLDAPGGGYGFDLRDLEGRTIRILARDERHADTADDTDRPRKISHLVLDSSDREGAFFRNVLGFKLSDQTGRITFLRCHSDRKADHHSIALYKAEHAGFNHVAFEMPNLDGVMRGAGRLRDAGYPIEWGVGRHGPANNVFSYFLGPDDYVIEYTSDVDQVDDSYKVGTPEDWKWPPKRIDRWGIHYGPTEKFGQAEGKIRFAA